MKNIEKPQYLLWFLMVFTVSPSAKFQQKIYIFSNIFQLNFGIKTRKKIDRKSICFLITFFIAIFPDFLKQFDTILRQSWAMLGPLGTHLGGFGGHLGASWGILGLSWNILKPFEAILDLKEVVFEQS